MKTNNNNTVLIIRYFDGELNEIEKENFFNELQINEELRKEFNSIKSIYELDAYVKDVKVSQEYLDSILPKFRSKQKNRFSEKIFNPKYALVFSFILIALTILFLLPKENEKPIIKLSDIPDEELIQHLSQDYSVLIQEDKVDSLFKAEIKAAPEKISYYVFNGDDIDNLYQKDLITPEDENEIYLTLIDKKF